MEVLQAIKERRSINFFDAGRELPDGPRGRFYFLEMNTRLQVEHAVTEAVLGLDLVRLQIEVAAGRPLPFGQHDLVARGHALECRIYAEDPEKDDLPSPGTVLHPAAPEGPGVRLDAGIAAGSVVSVHYDPLLAKLVTWGQDRQESLERMRSALERTAILGDVTNLIRLQSILAHPEFQAGRLHTSFIAEHLGELTPRPCPPPGAIAAAMAALHRSAPGRGARRRRWCPTPGPGSAPGRSEAGTECVSCAARSNAKSCWPRPPGACR